jgi:hypothetical protein
VLATETSKIYIYISGSGWYEKPVGVEKFVLGEGNGIPDADKAVVSGKH